MLDLALIDQRLSLFDRNLIVCRVNSHQNFFLFEYASRYKFWRNRCDRTGDLRAQDCLGARLDRSLAMDLEFRIHFLEDHDFDKRVKLNALGTRRRWTHAAHNHDPPDGPEEDGDDQ